MGALELLINVLQWVHAGHGTCHMDSCGLTVQLSLYAI